jgi:hypothetical protein
MDGSALEELRQQAEVAHRLVVHHASLALNKLLADI